MTTARRIITTALTVHLNRLTPGETLDADVGAFCLDALNDVGDEWSGSGTFLWKETTFASSALTGASVEVTTAWPTMNIGADILGATYNNGYGDFQIAPATMQEYHELVRVKSISSGVPRMWAFDGQTTMYFYPALASIAVTLRAKVGVSTFADLDTDYLMPKGYKSGFAAVVAERVAGALVGGVSPQVAKASNMAKKNLGARAMVPAIINGGATPGNILTGWN